LGVISGLSGSFKFSPFFQLSKFTDGKNEK